MATKLKVSYLDGREVQILASARAQVETERKFGTTEKAQAQQIESSFYLAWASLHYAGQAPEKYEEWLDLIADAEVVDPTKKTAADEAATDPTPAGQPSTGSSD